MDGRVTEYMGGCCECACGGGVVCVRGSVHAQRSEEAIRLPAGRTDIFLCLAFEANEEGLPPIT